MLTFRAIGGGSIASTELVLTKVDVRAADMDSDTIDDVRLGIGSCSGGGGGDGGSDSKAGAEEDPADDSCADEEAAPIEAEGDEDLFVAAVVSTVGTACC